MQFFFETYDNRLYTVDNVYILNFDVRSLCTHIGVLRTRVHLPETKIATTPENYPREKYEIIRNNNGKTNIVTNLCCGAECGKT
jgi:hypothetical protein